MRWQDRSSLRRPLLHRTQSPISSVSNTRTSSPCRFGIGAQGSRSVEPDRNPAKHDGANATNQLGLWIPCTLPCIRGSPARTAARISTRPVSDSQSPHRLPISCWAFERPSHLCGRFWPPGWPLGYAASPANPGIPAGNSASAAPRSAARSESEQGIAQRQPALGLPFQPANVIDRRIAPIPPGNCCPPHTTLA